MITGKVHDYREGILYIVAEFDDIDKLIKQHVTECQIVLDDGRTISIDQRKKIYALLNEISRHFHQDPIYTKEALKFQYIARTGDKYFSLSDVDMSLGGRFIEFLIEFCIIHEVPLSFQPIDFTTDIKKYVYACAVNRKCCICGTSAELHHVDAVGMGRDRKAINHLGIKAIPLCRKHHTETHQIGRDTFMKKYHIDAIEITDKLKKVYSL